MSEGLLPSVLEIHSPLEGGVAGQFLAHNAKSPLVGWGSVSEVLDTQHRDTQHGDPSLIPRREEERILKEKKSWQQVSISVY